MTPITNAMSTTRTGQYLGPTADKVALSPTYYLSSRRINLYLNTDTSINGNNSSVSGNSSDNASSNGSSGNSGNASNGAGTGTQSSGNANSGSLHYNPPTGAVTFLYFNPGILDLLPRGFGVFVPHSTFE